MESCHEKFRIGDLSVTGNQMECERRCTENQLCKFYFFGENKWCFMFWSCEERRSIETNLLGITYEKQRHGKTSSLCICSVTYLNKTKQLNLCKT